MREFKIDDYVIHKNILGQIISRHLDDYNDGYDVYFGDLGIEFVPTEELERPICGKIYF